ncbi:MAG: hypothetical protein ACI8RZ_006907, partial [Myxococcota bacterium]
CTDPDLGPLLHGMLQEARDEVADQRLAGLGGAWSALVDAWTAMLEGGRAALVAGLSPPIVLASDGTPETPPLMLVSVEDTIRARLTIPAGKEAALYLTDDTGAITRLLPPGPYTPADHALPISSGERATLWAVWGDALPRHPQPLDELQAALTDATVTAQAIRLQDDA